MEKKAYIVNTDEISKPRSHWLAIFTKNTLAKCLIVTDYL